MSKDKKVLTENPIVDELIYNGQILMSGCILKDQNEADKYETFESIKQSDFYMLIKENRIGFNSFHYDERLLSKLDVFSPEELIIYEDNNSLIPEIYRDQLLNIARQDFIDNYEELNDYYRTFMGLPSLENPMPIIITPDDLDGRSGYVWRSVRKQASLPLHEWDDEYINILEENGYLDKIKEEHPNLKYLNYLGNKKINLYTARKAERFECIYIPDCNSVDIQNHFYQLLERNRITFTRTLYTEAYKFDSDYYDKFLIVMIILQSFCDLIDEYAYYIIRRDIFDIRTIRYLFESNGVKFFEDIPIKYQLSLVRNLNRLVKYKSTDRNIIDICSLFGFKSVALFKFYILKDRKLTGDEYLYIKKNVSETWFDFTMPSGEYTDLIYRGGKYLALCKGNFILHSDDLNIWSKTTISDNIYNWKRIIYDNDHRLFVALSDVKNESKAHIAYSKDINTWKIVDIEKEYSSSEYTDLAYSGGYYVAISSEKVAMSSDLENWTYQYLGLQNIEIERNNSYVKQDGESIENFTSIIKNLDPYGNIIKQSVTFEQNTDGTYKKVVTNSYIMQIQIIQLAVDGNKFVAITEYGLYKQDKNNVWTHTYFDDMVFPSGTGTFPPDENGKRKLSLEYDLDSNYIFFVRNGKYYFINRSFLFIHDTSITSEKMTWNACKVGNDYNCTSMKFARDRVIILKNESKTLYMVDEDFIGINEWKMTELSSSSDYNIIAYGNFKFVIFPYGDKSDIGYYYTCNDDFEESTEQITEYDEEINNELYFIKAPLEGNVLDAMLDPNNKYKYRSIVAEDKYWNGDKDPSTVRKEILDHEFNILRTKYYTIDTIVEFSDITFQLSYFMNIIMNYDITDYLKIPLPFISGGGSYPIIDVFIFLFVLGFKYYGRKDDIVTTSSGVLTIRSFNFEADLNKLAETLYDKHHDKMYDLTEICGGTDFVAPKTPILTYKELMYIYNHNKNIYEYITNQMIHCNDKDLYDIYKKVYDALFIAKLNLENFSVLDDEGGIVYTYSTYTDYLKEKQFSMYMYIQDIDNIKNEKEKKLYISDAMNNVVSYVENFTPILDNGELEHIWHGLPTLDMDFIRHYITEVIKFFKSFKAELLNVSPLYMMCDKFDNMIWLIDYMHFDYTHDWNEFLKLYESIDSLVHMTEKEKIELKEFMFKEAYTIFINKGLSEDIEPKFIHETIVKLFKKDMMDRNHLEFNDYFDPTTGELRNDLKPRDVIDKMMWFFDEREDIYWYDKFSRMSTIYRSDNVRAISNMKVQSFWINEDHEITFSDPAYYIDK